MKHSLFVLPLLFLISTTAQAVVVVPPPPPTLPQGVKLASNHLLGLEGTYPNGDTGIGTYPCAFEWDLTQSAAYANVQGVTAMGLLAAFDTLHQHKYLGNSTGGALCAGDQIVARGDADPTARPYAQDLLFLSSLSRFSGRFEYFLKAETYHARTRAAFPTGADLADHYIDTRGSLAGWDLSSQIIAAKVLGHSAYARQIVDRLVTRRTDWEGVDFGGDWTLISHAALIGALDGIGGSTNQAYESEILASVLAAQEDDGSWADGDFQTTAYALMSLESIRKNHAIRDAIDGAGQFLLSTEDADGGWVYPPEYGEVDGEVLTALGSVLNDQEDHNFHGRRGPRFHPGNRFPRFFLQPNRF